MLDLSELKNLKPGPGHDHDLGTKLRSVRNISFNIREGTILNFCGYSAFYSPVGKQHVTPGDLFRIPGGARSWSDFNKRGRAWIEENFCLQAGFVRLSIWQAPDLFDDMDMIDLELI